MSRILIVSPIEYGRLTDQVKWCEYLKEKYEVIHFSQTDDLNEYEIKKNNLNIIKISKNNKRLLKRKIEFIVKINNFIKTNNPNIIIVDYFPGCSIIKLTNINKKIIMDVRTSTISKNKYKRYIRDFLIKIESLFFDMTTVITKNVAKKLKISNFRELPLGADIVASKSSILNKDKSMLNILYIGTFDEREIDKTIYAIKKLRDKNKSIKLIYTIVGFSNNKQNEEYLKSLIIENNLQEYVKFVGRVPHNELKSYYENHNIGLSFIPIKEYFDLQPPTKTYEYIMNGLFCIATNTVANREIINYKNGLLIDDDVNSIVNALEKIYINLSNINYMMVQETLIKHTWKNIVHSILIPIIEEVEN